MAALENGQRPAPAVASSGPKIATRENSGSKDRRPENPGPERPVGERDEAYRAASTMNAPLVERRRAHPGLPGILVLLVASTTMGQVGINIVLPSMPALAAAFETSPGLAKLSLTAFVVGLAFSQLFWGPFSDGFGRRRAIIIGATIYLCGTVACLFAPDIGFLIAARAVQGIGGGAGLVIGRAGIGDTFSGTALMKASGYATIAIGIVPAVAPLIGGALQEGIGWQGGFAATLIYAFILLIALWVGLPESNHAKRRGVALGRALSDYGAVLGSRSFIGYALTNALGLGALYALYTGSPTLFIEINGLSPSAYGVVLVGNSAAYILGSILTTRFSRDHSALAVLRIASLVMLLGSGLLLFFVTVMGTGLWPVILGAYLFALGLGMTLPVGFAAVLAMFEERKGTAAAVLGCLQLSVAALASAAVSLLGAGAATRFPVIMCVMVVASLPCSWWLSAAGRPVHGGATLRLTS